MFLRFAATAPAAAALGAFLERGGEPFILPVIAKQRSPHCGAAFDLHLFPMCWPVGPESGIASGWEVVLAVANVAPRARGTVQLAGPDPRAALLIDTQFLNDAEGLDAAGLSAGIDLARAWVRQPELVDWCGPELADTAALTTATALRSASAHYFHPVGTCRMGPDPAAGAVVNPAGRVYGWQNLYVADAAVMPTVPRANTNLPTLVVAEMIAAQLARQ